MTTDSDRREKGRESERKMVAIRWLREEREWSGGKQRGRRREREREANGGESVGQRKRKRTAEENR